MLKDGDIFIEVVENEILKEKIRFRRWADTWSPDGIDKRHSVVTCLPLDKSGNLHSWDKTLPLYSFFPTEEHLQFKVLLHASFDLDQSRKHVRDQNTEDILNHLEDQTKRILSEIPAEISLKAFFPEKNPTEELWHIPFGERIKSVLKQHEFIPCLGGAKAAPPKAKLWDYNLGHVLRHNERMVKLRYLVDPALLNVPGLRETLCDLGSGTVAYEDYLSMLKYCKNENLLDCQESLKVFFIIMRDHITGYPIEKFLHNLNVARKIPCWYTDKCTPRNLSDGAPLIRRKPENKLPTWLEFESLDKDFFDYLEKLESKNKKDKLRLWDKVLHGKIINDSDSELLNHLFVPTLETKNGSDWWDSNGGDVLHLYQRWTTDAKFIDCKVSICNDNYRERLGNALFLPTDKGWIPSQQCYAGKAWDGIDFFDTFSSRI